MILYKQETLQINPKKLIGSIEIPNILNLNWLNFKNSSSKHTLNDWKKKVSKRQIWLWWNSCRSVWTLLVNFQNYVDIKGWALFLLHNYIAWARPDSKTNGGNTKVLRVRACNIKILINNLNFSYFAFTLKLKG